MVSPLRKASRAVLDRIRLQACTTSQGDIKHSITIEKQVVHVSSNVFSLFVALTEAARLPYVIYLVQTSHAHPEQWEGLLEGGKACYFHYLNGRLTYGIGETMEQAMEDCEHQVHTDVGHNQLTTFAMMEAMSDCFDFSPYCVSKERAKA